MQIACPRVTEPKGQESWAVYTSVLTSHFLRNFRSGLFRQISSLDYGQSPLCSLEDLKCGMGCDNQQEHRAVLTARGMSSATDRGHCTLVRAQCKQPNWFLKMILWRKKNAECKLTHGSRFFFFSNFWNTLINRMEVYKWISKWDQCTQEGDLTWEYLQLTMRNRSDGRKPESKAQSAEGCVREDRPWDRNIKTFSADVFNFQMP